jgi:hypothetical protein
MGEGRERGNGGGLEVKIRKGAARTLSYSSSGESRILNPFQIGVMDPRPHTFQILLRLLMR